MREIKFRGKSLDNGEWVYGYYLVDEDNGYPLPTIFTPSALGDKNIGDGLHHVDPETVGQYTGIKDKNGKEIYEGDVVCDRWANCYTPIFRNGIYMAYNPKDLYLTKHEPSTQFNVIWKDGCEVIGNIYENPELLIYAIYI